MQVRHESIAAQMLEGSLAFGPASCGCIVPVLPLLSIKAVVWLSTSRMSGKVSGSSRPDILRACGSSPRCWDSQTEPNWPACGGHEA